MNNLKISADDIACLRRAKKTLEHPSFLARITHVLGKPVEQGFRMLPGNWLKVVNKATEKSLRIGLEVAVSSLQSKPRIRPRNGLHKFAVTASGVGGGMFGLAALSIELPVSTTLMLRSIADIAKSQGEDLSQMESRLACLQVFALGGRTPMDDASDSGYFAVRAVLAKAVSDASGFIAQRGLSKKGAPVIARLITQIAERFGIVVSQKVALQAVPAIGALGGGTVNLLFINHFQEMATGHFTIRRLERLYGSKFVQLEYQRLRI